MTTVTLTVQRGGKGATYSHDIPQFVETNADRAMMVTSFVNAFEWAYYGQGSSGEETDTVVADFIADLMHFADAIIDEGGDLVLSRAQGHYEAEIEEEREPCPSFD